MVDSTNLPNVDINQIATDLNNKMDRDFNNYDSNVITLIPDLSQPKNITNGMVLDDYYFLVGIPNTTDSNNSQFTLSIDGVDAWTCGWSGTGWSRGGAYSNLLIPGQTITINNSSYLGTLKLYKAKIHIATITT